MHDDLKHFGERRSFLERFDTPLFWIAIILAVIWLNWWLA